MKTAGAVASIAPYHDLPPLFFSHDGSCSGPVTGISISSTRWNASAAWTFKRGHTILTPHLPPLLVAGSEAIVHRHLDDDIGVY